MYSVAKLVEIYTFTEIWLLLLWLILTYTINSILNSRMTSYELQMRCEIAFISNHNICKDTTTIDVDDTMASISFGCVSLSLLQSRRPLSIFLNVHKISYNHLDASHLLASFLETGLIYTHCEIFPVSLIYFFFLLLFKNFLYRKKRFSSKHWHVC